MLHPARPAEPGAASAPRGTRHARPSRRRRLPRPLRHRTWPADEPSEEGARTPGRPVACRRSARASAPPAGSWPATCPTRTGAARASDPVRHRRAAPPAGRAAPACPRRRAPARAAARAAAEQQRRARDAPSSSRSSTTASAATPSRSSSSGPRPAGASRAWGADGRGRPRSPIGAAAAGAAAGCPPSVLGAAGAARRSCSCCSIGVFGAIFGLQPAQIGYGPSATARAEIPPAYLRLYVDAGAELRRRPVDPRRHRRDRDRPRPLDRAWRALRRQRLRLLRRPDAVLDRRPPEHLGPLRSRRQPRRPHLPLRRRRTRSPPPPATCAPAAPPATTTPPCSPTTTPTGTSPRSSPRPPTTAAPPQRRAAAAARRGNVGEVLRDPRIVLTPIQRADLHGGLIDPRLVSTLAAIARAPHDRRHRAALRPLHLHRRRQRLQPQRRPRDRHRRRRRRDLPRHPYGPVRRPRARARRRSTGRCARPSSSTAGTRTAPADPRGFARADHCDHIHWGMDA